MNDPDRIDPLALITKFAEHEKRLAEKNFLAPISVGGRVQVRVDGVVYDLFVDDKHFQGWGIFQMSAPGRARFVEAASMSLVNNYLKLFPRKRFVLIDRFNEQWFGISASNSDTRFSLEQPVPMRLLPLAAAIPLDTVNTRFDGSAFWFEGIDRRRDPKVATTLRRELESKTDPDEVRAAGMTPQERLVYRIQFLRRYQQDLPVDDRTRIANALNHADANLEAFAYQGDGETATVRFMVDGKLHSALINTSDMSVVASLGVCLQGRDRDFDLTSLVGVFREYNNSDEAVWD